MFVHIQIYPNRGRYGAGSGFPCWTSLIVIVGALYALSRKPVVVKIFFIGSEPQFGNGFTHLPESKLNRNKSWNISSVNSRIWFNHFGDCETPKGRLAPNLTKNETLIKKFTTRGNTMIIPFQRTLKENFCQRGTKAGKSISMPELFPNIPFKKCKQKGAKNGSDILCVADEEQMFHIPPTISTSQEEALLGSLGLQPF